MLVLALKGCSERLLSGTVVYRIHVCGVKHRFSPFEAELWRININKAVSEHKALLNGPDYTYLDKRPVPLGTRQFARLKQQQGYTMRIKELIQEIDFAKERYARLQQEKQNNIQAVLDRKLKPKGGFITTKGKLIPEK